MPLHPNREPSPAPTRPGKTRETTIGVTQSGKNTPAPALPCESTGTGSPSTLLQPTTTELELAQARIAAKQPQLLGLPLWLEGRTALFRRVDAHVQQAPAHTPPIQLHSVNAEISIQTRSDQAYRRLLTKNPVNIPDGEWVKRLVGFKYRRKVERISGSDLLLDLCAHAERADWAVYLLGTAEDISARAADALRQRFPTLDLERYSPPFTPGPELPEETTAEVLARLAVARPTVLFACFGSPKQELWIQAHQDALAAAGVRVVVGAGGSIDFVGGAVRRAPRLVSDLGLEWLWRLALQPRARFRRMATRLPRFLVLGVIDAITGRFARNQADQR